MVELVQKDLDESRNLLQRLLTVEDALMGTTITIVAAILALAFANESPAIAWLLLPLVAILSCLAARVAVQWGRVTTRIRVLEHVVDTYVSVLRERGASRTPAIARLDRELRRYSFGAQSALQPVRFKDLKRVNRRRMQWWLFPVIGGVVFACGLILFIENAQDSSDDDVCVRVAPTDVVRLDSLPAVASGSLLVVACDPGSTTVTPPRTPAPSAPSTAVTLPSSPATSTPPTAVTPPTPASSAPPTT